MVFGGSSAETIEAADYGLTLASPGMEVIYVIGETFGEPLREVDFNSQYNYFAWGGYKAPSSYAANALTVIQYPEFPPAFYVPSANIAQHFGVPVSSGLWFVINEDVLIQGFDEPTGAAMSVHKAVNTVYQDGALFSGPSRYATVITSGDRKGGYNFDRAGGPITSYLYRGQAVSVSMYDSATQKQLADSFSASMNDLAGDFLRF